MLEIPKIINMHQKWFAYLLFFFELFQVSRAFSYFVRACHSGPTRTGKMILSVWFKYHVLLWVSS